MATETRERNPVANGARPSGAQVPKLAEGIELIGEYEGSGFKESPYIARRGDGQVIQLSRLLHSVAEHSDGHRDFGQVAERVSEDVGRRVSRDNVRFLVEKKLRPIGVLAAADGSSPKLERADPMLALKFRAALIPERVVAAITTIFRPLFFPPVIVAVLAGIVAFDVWLFFVHGVAQSTRVLLYNPLLLLMVVGMVALSAAFHECGHATACQYGGARPGVMGAGIYIVWPAFYTDVTDAYRLSKAGRLRTDLGGVYFNLIFSLITAGVYLLTGFEPLLIVIVLQHLEILHQFLPFLRLDGYYIISDLTGVPDMFARIKPTLRSLIPGRGMDRRVEELKPWVRVVTSVYVLTLVPTLLAVFVLMVISAPRLFATAWDSFFVQVGRISSAFGDGKVITGVAGVVQTISLVLPVLGITLTTARGSRNLGVAAWRQTSDRPAARAALVSVAAAGLALAAFTLWPNGEYRPIQPGEKGTIQGGLEQVKHIPTGRPGLTAERQRELGGAPLFSKTGQDPLSTRPASASEGSSSDGAGQGRPGYDDGPAEDGSRGRSAGSRSGSEPDSGGSPGGHPGDSAGGDGGGAAGGTSAGGSGEATEPEGAAPPSPGAAAPSAPESGPSPQPDSGGAAP